MGSKNISMIWHFLIVSRSSILLQCSKTEKAYRTILNIFSSSSSSSYKSYLLSPGVLIDKTALSSDLISSLTINLIENIHNISLKCWEVEVTLQEVRWNLGRIQLELAAEVWSILPNGCIMSRKSFGLIAGARKHKCMCFSSVASLWLFNITVIVWPMIKWVCDFEKYSRYTTITTMLFHCHILKCKLRFLLNLFWIQEVTFVWLYFHIIEWVFYHLWQYEWNLRKLC